jgi:peptide methionine sulfoxide reductase MsrB
LLYILNGGQPHEDHVAEEGPKPQKLLKTCVQSSEVQLIAESKPAAIATISRENSKNLSLKVSRT